MVFRYRTNFCSNLPRAYDTNCVARATSRGSTAYPFLSLRAVTIRIKTAKMQWATLPPVIARLNFPNPFPVTTATTPTTKPQSSGFAVGDNFEGNCVVAWPTAPVITQNAIIMTMSCSNVPESEYLFTQVQYGDPNLDITPDTGTVQVTGKVVGVAKSELGFEELVVLASNIKF